MDRGKPLPGTRGPKNKITQQPPDLFIALGSKQTSSRDDPKRPVPLPKSSTSHLPSTSSKVGQPERKREVSSSSLQPVPPPKKMKVTLPNRPPGVAVPGLSNLLPADRSLGQVGSEPWENLSVDCDPCDLTELVLNNAQLGNLEKAVGYILGGIRGLRTQRLKPCKLLYSSLLLTCHCRPNLFTNEHVVNAIISSMRRDITAGLKTPTKNNSSNQILFINTLIYAFNDVEHWPEIFVKLYVEDAVGDRVWIDNSFCKPFVDNIKTAFGTKQPPKLLLASETWAPTGRDTSSPLTVNSNDDDESFNEQKALVDSWNIRVYPRYTQSQEMVEQIVLEAIKEQLTRRQQPDTVTKNFVRFLSIACGLVEIRVISVSRIENWLHNHKLMKPAQELLAYLCYNCSANTQRDIEVVAQLSKLRLKNKPLVTFFNNCLKEMVLSFPENLYPLLKYTIYNELSNTRNTNNLFVVGAMFQVAPDASADAFTDICLELLLNKDDYLRSLRALLKEINRVLRHDFNLLNIVHSMLRERKEITNLIRESEYRERMFLSLADLVCMCMLLCVNSQVRDAATQSKRDAAILQSFQMQVSNIQREAITWLHDSALRIFRPNISDFQYVLHKVLLLEQVDHYSKVDSWPGENERNLYFRLTSEVPLLEATLLRILLIGISKEHPVNANEIIDICDQLIRRSGNLGPDCLEPLIMDKIEIVDFFLNLCSYNYPENIGLPPGYIPPKLAISALYWKSWLMLLILAAHNPASFGQLAWTKYPILRMFMEMCITNHFSFPPPTMVTGETMDDYNSKEQQILVLEKQKILEFESHLAAASTKVEINEQTSLLLPQLMELNPQGDIRRPPQVVLDQLQNLNNTHRMGHLLCRSRHPDFLLDIMSRQGGTAHMPWLAELVHNSEGALAHLPVQCLCEYLLSNTPTEKLTKHSQLLAHLRTVANGHDPQNAFEVLEYLLRRLTSSHASSRAQAIKGLTLVLNPNDDLEVTSVNINNTHWLTHFISHFPHLNSVRTLLIHLLLQATLVETNPVHVSNYINFLATQGIDDSLPELPELILDLASLIVERSSITTYILPGENMQTLKDLISVFYVYLQRARQPTDDAFHWSENQDQVVVTWENGEQCTLQILIVHASIILLTYGPVENSEHFEALLDIWFPLNEDQPKAYLVDTSEEALLVPDWLKLRMIRSNVPRLVDAAVEKLEAPQLVLFIQSFGIPVVSISKLLQTLDKATIGDSKLVVDSVLDKNYMIQLVEVQNRRGAIGGEIFIQALEMQTPCIKDDEVIDIGQLRNPLPVISKRSVTTIDYSINNVINILSKMIDVNYHVDNKEDIRYLTKAITSDSTMADKIIDFLGTVPPLALLKSGYQKQSLVTLFRVLFTKDHFNEKTFTIATNILNMANDANCLLVINLKQFLQLNSKSIKREPDTLPDSVKINQLSKHDYLSNDENMDLLFSKQKLSFRPLLISVLLQRASWRTLSSVVDHLLYNEVQYCPVSVLDFLTALTQSPKLWQGRDKATPKHYHSENVLHLSTQQLQRLLDYILQEARETDDDEWERKMESRVPLLQHSISSSLKPIILHLLKKTDNCKRAEHLLMMLYVSIPCIRRYLSNEQKLSQLHSDCVSSAVDVISHTLISALTATARIKDWNRRSQDLELCTRKLAATHPDLVLRQLPMIAGSLRGRAQYDWTVLKSRGHFVLFGQVLGLLELLQPYVFQKSDTLCNILDSYFLLLKYHGTMKELNHIVSRIVSFLQNWMMKDIKNALKYLQQNGHVLNKSINILCLKNAIQLAIITFMTKTVLYYLKISNSNFCSICIYLHLSFLFFSDIQISQPSVRPLLSSVSFPTLDQSNSNEQILVGTATAPTPDPLPQHWPSLIAGLQSNDPLPSLQDLDHISNKKPQLLQSVSQHLYNTLSSLNSSVRTLSLNLVIKLLKHNPKASSEALPSILCCLESRNADIVDSVINRLPELVVTMQEYALVILTRVFQLGINSHISANTGICKSISLLNLQSGS
ncbi:hypothetical protein MML48_5g00000815 [Holotrichia oblita]|uniref:Uncharacterized protein n=1 Tax=Holotrichia oblita TaxID=644536 RepID=A0ACB9T4B9_HOLOL|nr:hypothetical protein MML48_5g00000815 [Holotrichia oblita]